MRLPGFLERFAQHYPSAYGLAKDVAFSFAVVAVIAAALYAYAGTWPPIVSVVGQSMYPHMHEGDLVLLQGLARDSVDTWYGSREADYQTYSDYGEVIVYRPGGRKDVHPVIHRAIYWVNASEPMWPGGPAAPEAGYITLGDNNGGVLDQQAESICYGQPVQKEWIVGIARYNIPYLGYIRSLIP